MEPPFLLFRLDLLALDPVGARSFPMFFAAELFQRVLRERGLCCCEGGVESCEEIRGGLCLGSMSSRGGDGLGVPEW